MSQFPSAGQPGTPNPFAPSPTYQPAKKSNVWLWILLGVGGLGLLVCCGCGGLMYIGITQAGRPLMAQLNADPTAQQHLGKVSSVPMMDIMATGEAAQKHGPPPAGRQLVVFKVTGDKGSGQVRTQQVAATGTFEDATLILPGGQEVKLGF